MSCNPYFNLDSTTKDLEANILSIGDLFDQQKDSALKYDSGFLNSAISTLGDFADIIKKHPEYDFPMIVDRVNAGPISPTEYADFLDATATDPYTVPPMATYPLTISAIDYLTNVDAHYTKNFSSSTNSLCTTFSGLLNKVFKLLDGINNIIASIASIKELLNGLIDKIKEKITKTIQQLTSKITAAIGSVKALADKVKKAADFFSDLNMQTLKDMVKNTIESVANKFKNITIENILYLTYRFCQLSNAVEQFMKAPLKSLQDDLKNADNIKNVLLNTSQEFTLKAVLSGAFRISDANADSIKNSLIESLNRSSTGSSGLSTPSIVNPAGQATPSHYYTKPFTDEERSIAAAIKATPGDQVRGSSHAGAKWFDFSAVGSSMDNPTLGIGVKNLQPEILIIGMRIATRLGVRLQINSGYRSPEANAGVGGASKSMHMSGLALDCRRAAYGTDFASGENFIKIASQEGAGGIGTYPTFIHIDAGPLRKWTNVSQNSPMSHWATLLNHANGRFQNGTPPSNANTPQ
jgi:hypothetical protein